MVVIFFSFSICVILQEHAQFCLIHTRRILVNVNYLLLKVVNKLHVKQWPLNQIKCYFW